MNKSRPKMRALLILLLFIGSVSFAQNFELNLKTMQGIRYQDKWGYFQGGLELSGGYHMSFECLDMSIGLNARTVQWGTQVSQSIAFSKSFGRHVEISAELQHGIALFLSKPLYVYSVGILGRIPVIKGNKIISGLSVGGRYTHCPAYRHYGRIDHVLEIPLGFFIRF